MKPKKIFAYSDFVSASPNQSNRFFVCPQYSIYHRRQKRLEGTNPARIDYEVIFLFDGTITAESGSASEVVLKDQSLLLNPSSKCSLSGKAVEYLQLTLTPLFVSDHAVRMQHGLVSHRTLSSPCSCPARGEWPPRGSVRRPPGEPRRRERPPGWRTGRATVEAVPEIPGRKRWGTRPV